MVLEVYADLYVLINAAMDLLCLTVTAAWLHLPVKRLRLLLAAGAGGLYALLSLLLSPAWWLGLPVDLLAAVGICAVAFLAGTCRFPRLLRTTGAYVLASTLLGGVMTVLYSLLNRLELPLDRLEGDGPGAWLFALLGAAAGLVTLKSGRLLSLGAKARYVSLSAELFGKTVTLRALLDSGNLLQDPLSGRSVIVTDRNALRDVLPRELLDADTQEKLTALLRDHELARGIRLIPIHTAAGDRLLPAVIPTRLTVHDGRTSYAADHLLAISDLGADARDFDAVMPDR